MVDAHRRASYNEQIMPETIPLQETIVYGPIHSRRLGDSLGINLLPATHKVCSSNCVYCQYGWTSPSALGERLTRAPELLQAIERTFQHHVALGTVVDCITLAGNGEPTLHPDLLEVVDGLRQLRDRYFPKATVGILSDATQVMRPRVQQALALLDVRYMKLDAGDESTWRRINEPLGHITFHDLVSALQRLPSIILQSMFMQGSYDNTQPTQIHSWIQTISAIKPLGVHVYTVDRGTAAPGITKVPEAILQSIAKQLTTATGIPTEVFA